MSQNKFEGIWAELELKKGFAETITHKILEIKSSLHGKQCTTGKV